MDCPRCGLVNPPKSVRCDCGYDFQSGVTHQVPGGRAGLPLASLGERFAGQVIDALIASGGLLLTAYISRSLGAGTLPALIPFYLYLLFADGMGSGQSVGKRVLNTYVVDEKTGAPCTYGGSFLRNVLMVAGIIDWVFIFGDKRQRLGDQAAGTVVIRKMPARG